jgi:hypothetical protein
MRRDWEPEELIASWTLVDDDWRLVGNKAGSTRLGFALLLKFFEIDARFPRYAGDVPQAAITYVAGQVKVPVEAFACDEGDPSYKGYLRIGGHLDYGHLLLTKNPNPSVDVPLAVDNDPNCGDAKAKLSRRQHMAVGSQLVGTWFWYGTNNACHLPGGGTQPVQLSSLGLSQEDWGPINPTALNTPVLFHGTINGVTITAARLVSPDGTRFDGVGLNPDIVVGASSTDGTDLALETAVQLLSLRLPVRAESARPGDHTSRTASAGLLPSYTVMAERAS